MIDNGRRFFACSSMHYLLPIIAMANFAAGLSTRAMDPVLPQVSAQLLVSIPAVATLASATAISFAFIQLPLGAIADLFGKPRLILTCLVILGLANIAGAFATSFEWLLVSRIVCGIGAGGVFPVAMGLVGDIFGIDKRQVAMSRILAGATAGNLLGATYAGVLGDFAGWRGVLSSIGIVVLLASIAVAWGFRSQMASKGKAVDIAVIAGNYRRILKHPYARICYGGVFIEGICVMGLFPFIAAFLQELGEPRLSIAGLVIAGFALGGLLYAASVARLLPIFKERGLIALGGAIAASQIVVIAFGPSWPAQFASCMVMGWGFFLIHGSFQVLISEIAPEARAGALSLQAFCFFCGQFTGPLIYGLGLLYAGKIPTLFAAAALLLVIGPICSWLLGQYSSKSGSKTTN
ncbi:MFS transporter [Afipia sp. P52-10]|uniref:MFS transporter n=1 Tax=Afipia sp. P52-10 TaxID=1429916 RepID=UPI0004BC2077|nr:MFS transporter [Afipia sp. P52-10]